ncbi:hypothetical protein [Mycoplasmopsis primatum]|uniref:hypothetical protein n=1 Tax=Mycoplasmopsis primatum TaxID=55604 RepID=UPI0004956D98|nr:hypothetical protein [Mycoplasmopsis primatum]
MLCDEEITLNEDSTDNKKGADLVVVDNKLDTIARIELKFGNETIRNIGNKTMSYLFTLSNSAQSFDSLFSDISKSQRSFVLQNNLLPNDDEKIDQNLKKLLSDKLASISDIKVNDERIDQLLKTTGNIKENVGEKIFKVKISYNDDINKSIKMVELPNSTGIWKIQNISLAPKSSRLQIIISNESISVKFLLNWKNNYKFNGLKYAARLGLGSSSWNVWVSKIKP